MYSINSITSFAVASPVFITNPLCFVETCAPPMLYPFSPASSINFAVINSFPLLNVLPALGYSIGCFSFLYFLYSSILLLISSYLPFCKINVTSVTMYLLFFSLLSLYLFLFLLFLCSLFYLVLLFLLFLYPKLTNYCHCL